MSNGIYGYYDTKNQYVIYIGQDACIDKERRHKAHLRPSLYNKQKINQILQNNSDRYVYFKFIEGDYTQGEIDDFEEEAIKLFKTYKYDYPERNVFNFTPGGDFNPMRVSEMVKKRFGENHPFYGKTHSAEARKKVSEAHKGKKHSPETRKKMSEVHSKSKNTSGYFRVSKLKNGECKQGFIWRYCYTENGKRKCVSSVDLNKLEKKVINKGLEWRKFKK